MVYGVENELGIGVKVPENINLPEKTITTPTNFTSISITNYDKLYSFIRGVKFYEYTDKDMYIYIMNQILSYVKSNMPELLDKFYDEELLLPIVPQHIWDHNLYTSKVNSDGIVEFSYEKKEMALNSALIVFDIEKLKKDNIDYNFHLSFLKGVLTKIDEDLKKEDFTKGNHYLEVVDSDMFPGIFLTTNPIIIWVVALDPYVKTLYLNKVVLSQVSESEFVRPLPDSAKDVQNTLQSSVMVKLDDIAKFYGLDKVYEHNTADDKVIAIIDTGIDKNHKWFTGRIKEVHSVFNDDGTDRFFHGTHVAGIISKLTQSQLVIVKALGDNGAGNILTMDKALGYIYNHPELGVDIINMSLGMLNTNCDGKSHPCPLCQMVKKLWEDRHILSAVASGNFVSPMSLSDKITIPLCPGKCYTAFRIGSINYDLEHSWFSRYDSTKHPTPSYSVFGESILSACSSEHVAFNNPPVFDSDGNLVVSSSGTSMATPVFASILALYLSEFRDYSTVFKKISNDYLYISPQTGKVLYPFSLIQSYLPEYELTIVVVDTNGTPITNADVGIDNNEVKVTDLSGTVKFTVKEGTHSVTVAGSNIVTTTKTVTVNSDTTLTIVVERTQVGKGNLKVTVIDKVSNVPLSGASVVLKSDSFNKQLITNSNGNVYYSNLDPGKYKLTVVKTGYNTYSDSIDIKSGSNEITVKISPLSEKGSLVYPMFMFSLPMLAIGGAVALKGLKVEAKPEEVVGLTKML